MNVDFELVYFFNCVNDSTNLLLSLPYLNTIMHEVKN